jgi:two-component system response regulator AtoC
MASGNSAAPFRVLIIDDEKNLRDSIAGYLVLDGFLCSAAASGEEALALLESEVFDAAILDLRLPGIDGLGVLRRIGPGLPVIMISAHGDIADAVKAMKLGAVDYLVKPFDPAELSVRLSKAIEDSRLIRRARIGLAEERPLGFISTDPAMDRVTDIIGMAAPTLSTVLITGESGTGKEIAAGEIHRRSGRASGPFVPVNVSAIPEPLFESELFGHEKGAFTGADSRRPGLFELAAGGTLFLDELGEIPLSLQVKLLRVLQERRITRVGGSRDIPVDVRVIAATNRDIEKAVAAGDFRKDLYYRLNVIRIELPPLRERPLDIAPLAGFFLARYAKETGKPVTGISPAALRALSGYPFPGNIRELENSIERAVILCKTDTLTHEDFPFTAAPDVAPGAGGKESVTDEPSADTGGALTIRDIEKQAISAALSRNGGRREQTAHELGISRRTLLNKMREYGIT